MAKSHVQVVHHKVKAVHRYEVVEAEQKLPISGRSFHFIGAGGVGMSGLAQVLLNNNAVVTGSDQAAGAATAKLRRLGAEIKTGHKADHLPPQADVVVISAAITDDNPELKLARQRGLKVYKYAQMLGELMAQYRGIAISGTHGKSTTCGWLVHCLKQAGIDTNFVVGAEITQLGSSSGTGSSDLFVAEACEYDRSFLNLRPAIACILNIERDHLDCYRNEQEIVEAFAQFALGTKPDGVVIVNGQDPNVAEIMSQLGTHLRFETFGMGYDCNFQARNVRLSNGLYSFNVAYNGKVLGKARISIPGRHNVMNAMAVIATAVNAGVPAELVIQLLPDFAGVDRRVTLRGRFNEITVLDDYAHHPTEIKASLEAIRQRYDARRVWCVFQPHQYSRTKFLLDEFAASFGLADFVIIPEIYFVRDSQADREQVNSKVLVEKVRDNGTDAMFISDFAAVCDYLEGNVEAGDLVVTMGAGDVWKVADEYIQRLRANS